MNCLLYSIGENFDVEVEYLKLLNCVILELLNF